MRREKKYHERYFLFLGIIFLPLFSFAQLDQIHPGMSTADYRTIFPSGKMEQAGNQEQVHAKDTVEGVSGNSTYTFFLDTVNHYKFFSHAVAGPCKKFPSADSTELSRLLDATRKLYSELVLKFGVPGEKYSSSVLFPKETPFEISVFGAKWKLQGAVIIVKVVECGDPNPFPNADMENYPKERSGSCYYELQIEALGMAKTIYPQFNMGFSKNDFRKKYPLLSDQIKDSPEIWLAQDSAYGKNGEWRCLFLNDKLTLFSLNDYDGDNYDLPAKDAYSKMCNRLSQLIAEAQKQFGVPDSASPTLDAHYKTQSLHNSYSIVHYRAKWKVNGTEMILQFEESGGGINGPPKFHLSVYDEEKK